MTEQIEQLDAEELARKAGEGSSACFSALVSRFAGRLFHYLQHKVGSAHDAEDLVQETFLRVLRHIDRYDPTRPFAPWLFTIATRLAISHHRGRTPAVDIDALELRDRRCLEIGRASWRERV